MWVACSRFLARASLKNEVPSMKASMIGTKAQLAALLGLSERRITDLISAKVIPPRGKAGFDLAGSVKSYIGFLKAEPGTLSKERTRLAKFKADLADLQLQERRGELVNKEAVKKVEFATGRTIRDSLQNIPSRVSGLLAAERDQEKIFVILEREIHQTLTELSA